MGDAMARKKDGDVLALFSALNGGTDLGSAGRDMEFNNLNVLIAFAKANKFPKPVQVVHHPYATFHVFLSFTGVAGGGTMGAGLTSAAALPSDFSQDLLKDFFEFSVSGVPVFQDGNVVVDASNDGVGAIFSREAMVYLESVGFVTTHQRDESLRATEVIVLSDYGVFELDDTYGAPCTFQAASEATD